MYGPRSSSGSNQVVGVQQPPMGLGAVGALVDLLYNSGTGKGAVGCRTADRRRCYYRLICPLLIPWEQPSWLDNL